jgi:ParB family chromosome partitioning protein
MAAEKGLGRGLGVLFGDAAAAEELENVYLPITKVESAQRQPRYIFEENALYELSVSIKQHGIIQPLTVRKLPSGNYEIIAGERRWRAARMAGLEKIPVRIIEADDRKAAELALVENLQREDLNPVEEATGFRLLMDVHLYTQDQVADTVAKSRAYISNSLRILQLDPDLLQGVEEGIFSPGHAKALLVLKAYPNQQAMVARRIMEQSLSVRQAEMLAKEILAKAEQGLELPEYLPKTKQPPTKARIFLDDMANRLEQQIGRKVRISGTAKSGKVTIEYYSKDDLDALYGYLARS